MYRRVLIPLILFGIFLTACGGGQQSTDDEVYPAPTNTPPDSDMKLLPYPVDEENRPQIVNPVREGAYPAPEGLEPYPVLVGNEAYAPGPGDEDMIRSDVLVEGMKIRQGGSDSDEYYLDINGSLRNPCYELRIVVLPPNEESRIDVDVYSVLSPDSICTQVLEPFETSVSLGTYTGGEYTVWANDEMVEDIQP